MRLARSITMPPRRFRGTFDSFAEVAHCSTKRRSHGSLKCRDAARVQSERTLCDAPSLEGPIKYRPAEIRIFPRRKRRCQVPLKEFGILVATLDHHPSSRSKLAEDEDWIERHGFSGPVWNIVMPRPVKIQIVDLAVRKMRVMMAALTQVAERLDVGLDQRDAFTRCLGQTLAGRVKPLLRRVDGYQSPSAVPLQGFSDHNGGTAC